MDSYAPLLQKLNLPHPTFQKLAVISIFQKLQSSPPYLNPDSDPGRSAITHCLQSHSPHIIDQSIRELCRFVTQSTLTPSRALLELQSALESCPLDFVDLFVKGIAFIVRFSFRNEEFNLDSVETHPFVKVLVCRSEVENEVVKQVGLFIVKSRVMGVEKVCEFLHPLLIFSILRIPFKGRNVFARELVSAIASLCCTFPGEDALPVMKLLVHCLKYFPCRGSEDLKDILYVAECLVDAFIVILKQSVEAGVQLQKSQLCGVELLYTLLSLYTDLDKHCAGKETIVELSKHLLLVQKELGMQYIPEFSYILTSLFLILSRTDFEHEQLSTMKMSIFLLKWKLENEYAMGNSTHCFSDEIFFIFPVVGLLSSPSGLVKAAANDLVSMLEKLLKDLLVTRKNILNFQEELPSISKPEFVVRRLLRCLWFQEHHSSSSSPFLSIAFSGKTEINYGMKSWLSQLKEYCLKIVERRKSRPSSHFQENIVTEMPLLLSSVVAVLVMHHLLGNLAVDSLATIGILEPKVGLPLLLTILFYNKALCNNTNGPQEILLRVLEMLPSIASHSALAPLVVQSILPMLDKDAKPVLHATATRLLCKTWEATDRVFESLQVILDPTAFNKIVDEKNISISMAASVRDVCRKSPDRGVDLILSVS